MSDLHPIIKRAISWENESVKRIPTMVPRSRKYDFRLIGSHNRLALADAEITESDPLEDNDMYRGNFTNYLVQLPNNGARFRIELDNRVDKILNVKRES